MSPKYYSQNGEDALLWSVFAGQTTGRFIDVGAFDGRYLSNSFSFEEMGWTGICVEPHPDYFPRCQANRPRSICVHAACVDTDEMKSTEFFSEPLGILSGIRAFETKNMELRYARRNMVFNGFNKIDVPARTIDDIVAEHWPGIAAVDFISIDVEGTEVEVLRGCSIEARVIVAEANAEQTREGVFRLMERRGYIFARSIQQNHFFARDADGAQALTSAAFDIPSEKVMHPLCDATTEPGPMGRRFQLDSSLPAPSGS